MKQGTDVYKIGYSSCNICIISLISVSILSVCMSFIKNQEWKDIDTYFVNFSNFEVMPEVIGLITIPIVLFVASAIYCSLDYEKRFWGIIIIIFSTMATVILELSYFCEVAIAFPMLNSGITKGTEMLLFANPNSVVRALKNLGYFILTLGYSFTFFALGKSRMESVIKKIAIVMGGLNFLFLLNIFINNSLFKLGSVLSCNFLLPLLMLLLGYYFRNKMIVNKRLEKKQLDNRIVENTTKSYYADF